MYSITPGAFALAKCFHQVNCAVIHSVLVLPVARLMQSSLQQSATLALFTSHTSLVHPPPSSSPPLFLPTEILLYSHTIYLCDAFLSFIPPVRLFPVHELKLLVFDSLQAY